MYESRGTLCVLTLVFACVCLHTHVWRSEDTLTLSSSLLGIPGIQVRWSGLQAPLPAEPLLCRRASQGACQLLLKVENLFLLCMIFLGFLFPKSMLLNGLWPETVLIVNSLQKSDHPNSRFRVFSGSQLCFKGF